MIITTYVGIAFTYFRSHTPVFSQSHRIELVSIAMGLTCVTLLVLTTHLSFGLATSLSLRYHHSLENGVNFDFLVLPIRFKTISKLSVTQLTHPLPLFLSALTMTWKSLETTGITPFRTQSTKLSGRCECLWMLVCVWCDVEMVLSLFTSNSTHTY